MVLATVFVDAKLQNWKQFTTHLCCESPTQWLFLSTLNYKIESNSQLCWEVGTFRSTVFVDAKLQNWKQFTTTMQMSYHIHILFLSTLNYKIESNSQQAANQGFWNATVFVDAKLQNWKQFTTQFTFYIDEDNCFCRR